MERRVLLVGYGNPYRRDDGVALHVLNHTRARLGLSALGPDDEGFEDLGQPVDALMLHQLVPELASIFIGYDLVVFVDAHTGAVPEEVRVTPVREEHALGAVTHHLSPGLLLSLTEQASGAAPEAYLVSVLGEDFDFGQGLSEGCRLRVPTAAERILALLPAWKAEGVSG